MCLCVCVCLSVCLSLCDDNHLAVVAVAASAVAVSSAIVVAHLRFFVAAVAVMALLLDKTTLCTFVLPPFNAYSGNLGSPRPDCGPPCSITERCEHLLCRLVRPLPRSGPCRYILDQRSLQGLPFDLYVFKNCLSKVGR